MKKSLRYLAIILFFMLILCLGLFKIVSFDFGWHLKAGEYILSHRSIPTADVFSYIAQGNKWVDSHWLFQVILYISYFLGGATGCIVLRTLVLLLTFGVLYFTIYQKQYYYISLIVCLFAIFISFQRFLLRPELFTFLFLALFFYFIERFSSHPRLSLIMIPLCQVLWVNMHGLFILGIVFLTLYLFGDLLQAILSRYLSFIPRVEIQKREWKQRGILFCLTCFALIFNGNGMDGIKYPFKLFSELKTKSTVFSQIAELVSPFAVKNVSFPDPTIIYKVFILISLVALVCQLRRIRFSHLFAYTAFLYLSVLAVRNMSLFAIVATPITVRNMVGIADFFLKEKKGRGVIGDSISYGLGISFVVFVFIISYLIINNTLYKRLNYLRNFGIGVSDYYPKEAVEFIKDEKIQGNIFNSSDIGGYLLWKMYPEKKVALDGRWEVYGDFLNEIPSLKNHYYFAQLAALHDIQAIILYKYSLEFQLMGPWLQMSRQWLLVKDTPLALIYKRAKY